MGNTYTRKATFTVQGRGDKRVFTPVNHRAHIVCKRKKSLTHAELKATQGKGTYTFWFYNKGDGQLKPIVL